jgi:hypothetical protein
MNCNHFLEKTGAYTALDAAYFIIIQNLANFRVERRNDLGQGMSEGYSFSFLRSLFTAETAAFVAAPLAGETIRA